MAARLLAQQPGRHRGQRGLERVHLADVHPAECGQWRGLVVVQRLVAGQAGEQQEGSHGSQVSQTARGRHRAPAGARTMRLSSRDP